MEHHRMMMIDFFGKKEPHSLKTGFDQMMKMMANHSWMMGLEHYKKVVGQNKKIENLLLGMEIHSLMKGPEQSMKIDPVGLHKIEKMMIVVGQNRIELVEVLHSFVLVVELESCKIVVEGLENCRTVVGLHSFVVGLMIVVERCRIVVVVVGQSRMELHLMGLHSCLILVLVLVLVGHHSQQSYLEHCPRYFHIHHLHWVLGIWLHLHKLLEH
jgi:hypothetical protein